MQRHNFKANIPTGSTTVSAPPRYIYVVTACHAPHKRPNVKRPYQFLNAFPTHISTDASLLHVIPKNAKLEIVTFAGRMSPESPSRIPETLNLAVITQTRKEQQWTTIIRGWANDRRTAALLMQECVLAEAVGQDTGKKDGLMRSRWVWEHDEDGYMNGGHDTSKKALRYDVVRVEVGEGFAVEWSKTLGDAAKVLGEDEDRMEVDADAVEGDFDGVSNDLFKEGVTHP